MNTPDPYFTKFLNQARVILAEGDTPAVAIVAAALIIADAIDDVANAVGSR